MQNSIQVINLTPEQQLQLTAKLPWVGHLGCMYSLVTDPLLLENYVPDPMQIFGYKEESPGYGDLVLMNESNVVFQLKGVRYMPTLKSNSNVFSLANAQACGGRVVFDEINQLMKLSYNDAEIKFQYRLPKERSGTVSMIALLSCKKTLRINNLKYKIPVSMNRRRGSPRSLQIEQYWEFIKQTEAEEGVNSISGYGSSSSARRLKSIPDPAVDCLR